MNVGLIDDAVLDNGEHLTVVGADNDSDQAIIGKKEIGMHGVSRNPDDTAENDHQLDAEKLAQKAEKAHQKVESFKPRFASLGRQQVDSAIEAGQYLLEAKKILRHGNFQKEQKRWRINKTIIFSPRSGRRYMLLATHAEAIKMAKVATLREAEKLASALEEAADCQKAGRTGEPAKIPVAAPANSAADLETQALKAMRRFADVGDQRAFLTSLIEKLNHRLELLAS